MRSIGTRIVKFNKDKTATLSDNVRMNPWQFITRYGDMEGHHDGSNSGKMTREDLIVGFSTISIMSGAGAMIETGFSVFTTLSTINSIDDLIVGFTDGKTSLSHGLFPERGETVDIVKTIVSGVGAGKGMINFTKYVSKGNYFNIMSTTMDMIGSGNNLKNTISNEKSKQPEK